MGLFSKLFGGKKEEQEPVNQPAKEAAPAEKNEINNRELKEALASAALKLLTQGKDYEELAGLQCQFGYLFQIEDHGLEALFKVTTDKGVIYFAAQKTSLMRLNFTEELFRGTTETFLEMHKG